MELEEVDMESISKQEKHIIMNQVGELIIRNVRDDALKISMDIVMGDTRNCIKKKQYRVLSDLTEGQKDAICNLLSETVTDTIYRFLELFEEKSGDVKMTVNFEGKEYNILDVSEKMGSEIAYDSPEGWIQKYSKIGRFVLF